MNDLNCVSWYLFELVDGLCSLLLFWCCVFTSIWLLFGFVSAVGCGSCLFITIILIVLVYVFVRYLDEIVF